MQRLFNNNIYSKKSKILTKAHVNGTFFKKKLEIVEKLLLYANNIYQV